MTRTDGEHELVLGNKQLLSAFFIVVILLGVFFTMGYFVGRNTATSGFNAGQTASGGANRPDAAGRALDGGSTSAPSSSAAPETTTSAADPTPAAATPTPTPVATAPPAETHSAPAPAAAPPERHIEHRGADGTDAVAEAVPHRDRASSEFYLQVFALRKPDALNEVKILKERGYPALLGESSKEGIYRVLVGPYKSSGEMGRAKADLKAKGIDSIVAK